MLIKRKSIATILIVLFCMTLVVGCDSSKKEEKAGEQKASVIELTFAHIQPEDLLDPYHVAASTFKERLEKYSEGKIKVNIFPNAQLGDERVVTEGVQNGSVDCSVVTTAVTGNFQPLTRLVDLPFVFADEKNARAILSGPIGRQILDSMEEVKIKGLAFTENGMRAILNTKRQIKTPADLNGLKLRVMQNPIYIDFYSALNVNAVPLPFGEVYTAVQQGTVDGLDLAPTVIEQTKMHEVNKYLTDIKYTYTSLMIIMNNDKFKGLSPELQAAVMKASAEAAQAVFDSNDKAIPVRMASLEKLMKVTQHDEVDIEAFRAVSEEVWTKYTQTPKAKEILAAIQAEIKK